MSRKIKYLGFYNPIINKDENRNTILSATNKMDYVVSKLNQLGWNVELVSPSWTYNNDYYKGKTIQIEEKVSLILSPTLPWNKISKFLSMLFNQFWLFLYLLFHTKKDERIIAYHSLYLMYPLYYAKKIKRFNLILEVEEIYQDVKKCSKSVSKMEYKMFRIADEYIFSTELLNEKLNTYKKPHAVIYGTYQIEQDRKRKIEDGKIHAVYAGTLDPTKGAVAAIAAAKFLPEGYHIHIVGFGSNDEKLKIMELVGETAKTTRCSITYDGLLSGEEYIQFLQKCDIGLCTQIPDATYNETSFPSKILSYLTNGLRVISVRIKAIENSKISSEIIYIEKYSPEEIAKTIKSIDFSRLYDSRRIIQKIETSFINELSILLKESQ